MRSQFYDYEYRTKSNHVCLKYSTESHDTLELWFRALKAVKVVSAEELSPEIFLTINSNDFDELTSYWYRKHAKKMTSLEYVFNFLFTLYARNSELNKEENLDVDDTEGGIILSRSNKNSKPEETDIDSFDIIERMAVVPEGKALQLYIDDKSILVTHVERHV